MSIDDNSSHISDFDNVYEINSLEDSDCDNISKHDDCDDYDISEHENCCDDDTTKQQRDDYCDEDDISENCDDTTKQHDEDCKNILKHDGDTTSKQNDCETIFKQHYDDKNCEFNFKINEKCDKKKFIFKNLPKEQYTEFKMFYYMYRIRQKISGSICGAVDGGMTGYYIGMKWGGAGGFLIGGLSQLCGMLIPGMTGFTGGILQGMFTDKKDVIRILSDYRCNFGAGGLPPTHGSLS